MHLGFIPEMRVLALRRAPAGDPTVYCVDGAEIALRRETAKFISVHSICAPKPGDWADERLLHPRGDRYH